jgi:dihydrofolate reductase
VTSQTRDVVAAGSAGVVTRLRTDDLVDQYRLLVFPVVLGEGRRLFDALDGPVDLEPASAESEGKVVRLVYDRERAR